MSGHCDRLTPSTLYDIENLNLWVPVKVYFAVSFEPFPD